MIIYTLVPYLMIGFIYAIFAFKLYKRSISTTMSIIGFSLTSTMMYYGYVELGLVIISITMTLLIIRSITLPCNDKLFIKYVKNDRRRR